jgi:putative phage-type endonuclease
VDEVVKEYKRMRLLDLADPKYIDDIYKIVKANCSYFMSEEEIKVSFQCINDILKQNDFLRYEEWVPTTLIVCPEIIYNLELVPQPDQKSNEWYLFRHDHITASNAWKALSTQSNKNQLIYEKCMPMNTEKFKPTLNENSLTWGHKYEPLSNLLYELKMNTKVKEFGCIEHPVYKFLAASPDGIVVGENNYGRMLEIKNVVSRVIDGCPKKEYYIQMQLQMEVCNLDECDFVETKFTEYDGYQQFMEDTNQEKGIIVTFVKDNKFVYEYMPFDANMDEWVENIIKSNENDTCKWFKNIYWKLDVFSCVLVKRNKEWFNSAIKHMEELWRIVCEERQTGEFSKRAPKKKNVKTNIVTNLVTLSEIEPISPEKLNLNLSTIIS